MNDVVSETIGNYRAAATDRGRRLGRIRKRIMQ